MAKTLQSFGRSVCNRDKMKEKGAYKALTSTYDPGNYTGHSSSKGKKLSNTSLQSLALTSVHKYVLLYYAATIQITVMMC